MNREKILITASDNIPPSKIHQQFGIVDSQIVIGANIFRDVFSSFRDVFGGETKGYKKDLHKMKNAAFQEIKEQANKLGANAIISLKIDLDEISGSGKSMFMINVYGSAVKLEKSVLTQDQEQQSIDEILIEDIEYHKERNTLRKEINDTKESALKVNLDKISKYDLWDSKTSLRVLKYYNSPTNTLEKNFSEIPINYIEKFLRDSIHKLNRDYWNLVYKDFNERNWLNHTFLLDLLQSENYIKRFRALKLCLIKKKSYQRKEIDNIKSIGHFLLSEFDSSVESREISKVIGNKTVFTCPYCLIDRPLDENKLCECGRNKYGFLEYQNNPESIGKYLLLITEAMESAFNQYN